MSNPQSTKYPSSPPTLTASSSQSTTTAGQSLADLFGQSGYSPPHKSDEVPLAWIETEANDILKHHADSSCSSWDQLQSHKKVALAFLIYKKQHEWLSRNYNQDKGAVATAMMEKVDQICWNPAIYSPLAAFLRKGGDGILAENDAEDHDYWDEFLTKHPDWRGGENVFTIFTHEGKSGKRVEKPFVRFQEMNSMICFIISAAQVLLYCMMQRTGEDLASGVKHWGINIGRYMRNNLTEEQVYRTIFLEDGGYPQRILETLLTHSVVHHPDACAQRSRKIDISEGSKALAEYIKSQLKIRGALLVCGLRTFPDFEDRNKTEFGGDWNKLKADPAGTIRHAAVIVGVMHTGDDNLMGGIKCLLQDTLPGRPFVSMGIDLLRSMGIEDFEGVEKDASFLGTTGLHNLDVGPGRIVSCTSGSPHASKTSTPSEIVCLEYEGLSHRSSSLSEDQGSSQEASASKEASKKPDFIGFDDLKNGKISGNFVCRT